MIFKQLKPFDVWRAFEEISRIPRGKGCEQRVSDYIYYEALSHGLYSELDQQHNVLVRVPATDNRENETPIVIRAHLDMLEVTSDDTEHEYEDDGIELLAEGDTVWANGAVLGADDGIGVAMMIALFRDKALSHPALELLFMAKADEPIQAASFDMKISEEGRHINLDYERESMLINGTSGNMITEMLLPIKRDSIIKCDGIQIQIRTGETITAVNESEEAWISAIDLMGRLLNEVKEETILIDLNSEQSYNDLPTIATAMITSENNSNSNSHVIDRLKERFDLIKKEYSMSVQVQMIIEKKKVDAVSCSMVSYNQILAAIALMPSGVIGSNLSIDRGAYNNIYRLNTEEEQLIIGNITRYAHQTQGEDFCDRLHYLAELMGAKVSVISNIPVWNTEASKHLWRVSTKAFNMPKGINLQNTFSHKSTETAVLAQDIEAGEDITITFGPDIQKAHTVNESVSISSVQRTYNLLQSIVASKE